MVENDTIFSVYVFELQLFELLNIYKLFENSFI